MSPCNYAAGSAHDQVFLDWQGLVTRGLSLVVFIVLDEKPARPHSYLDMDVCEAGRLCFGMVGEGWVSVQRAA